MTRIPKLIFTVAALAAGVFFVSGSGATAADDRGSSEIPPIPTGMFSPSNARTESGNFIPAGQFFPSSRCAGCHNDTHAAWSQSLHRNAARDPFYRESADILLRARGVEITRHCESCHTPIALFSGALSKESGKTSAPFTSLDDEGVTCSVCHSITEARLDGTGSFTIRRPALLAREDGSPISGDFTDEQILADVPSHKRAVMRPLLKQPEFCSTCHKVDAPPSLNGYKRIRGFSAYDEWQQSGASLESVTPFYKREQRADCRACHMPKIESNNDRAAKNGMIASHRWLGANTAAPLFYGQDKQAELIATFLESNQLAVDIFALRSEASGRFTAPLGNRIQEREDRIQDSGVRIQRMGDRTQESGVGIQRMGDRSQDSGVRIQRMGDRIQDSGVGIQRMGDRSQESGVRIQRMDGNPNPEAETINLSPGEEVTAEVVIANRNVAHSFPPEVRDLYEAWVEFEAIDSTGKTIFHSGFIKPDGMLDESAHVYKQIILDETGRPITRHQIWLTNIKAYDNTIPAGRSDLVRFRFRVPESTAVSDQKSAVSDQQSAVRNKKSAVSDQRSAVRNKKSPVSDQQSAISSQRSAFKLRARVNYRRVNQEYANYVLGRRDKQMNIPIVRMAESDITISVEGMAPGKPLCDLCNPSGFARNSSLSSAAPKESRRWNDYGIALLEQAQYGPAAEAFRRAAELDPLDPNPLVSAALAEMRTERFGLDREQLRKARALLDAAMRLDPDRLRTLFYEALVLRAEGKAADAARIFAKLAIQYPRDREVQRQLGQTLYTVGRLSEARAAFEAVAAIDPTDAGAYQFLTPIYTAEGRKLEAERARALYLQWRDDPLADSVGARFFAAHPEWSDERISTHTHGFNSAGRKIPTGALAAPLK